MAKSLLCGKCQHKIRLDFCDESMPHCYSFQRHISNLRVGDFWFPAIICKAYQHQTVEELLDWLVQEFEYDQQHPKHLQWTARLLFLAENLLHPNPKLHPHPQLLVLPCPPGRPNKNHKSKTALSQDGSHMFAVDALRHTAIKANCFFEAPHAKTVWRPWWRQAFQQAVKPKSLLLVNLFVANAMQHIFAHCCLGYIGDYTTQLYRDCKKKPLQYKDPY